MCAVSGKSPSLQAHAGRQSYKSILRALLDANCTKVYLYNYLFMYLCMECVVVAVVELGIGVLEVEKPGRAV